MQFHLIGPFRITTDEGETFAPKAPKICQMLAVLALQPREPVAAETLVRELWGENPPSSAPRTLQTHVYHARRMLHDAQVASGERKLLLTQAPGYFLDVARDEVDACVFEELVRLAQQELHQGAPEKAAAHLNRARDLWRGPMLSNVPVAGVLHGRIAHMEELKIRALELRVESEFQLGRYREILPELRILVHDHPLHEWFHGRLISALHQAGRRAEALQAYQNLYSVLRRELGLEPSEELQRLQADILNASTDGPLPHRGRPKSLSSSVEFTRLWDSAVAS